MDVIVYSDYGFYFCCTMRLYKILEYFNINKRLPVSVDSSRQFTAYKEDQQRDYTFEFFQHYDSKGNIAYLNNIEYSSSGAAPCDAWSKNHFPNGIWRDDQFSNYKLLNFEMLEPFINKYFSPSDAVNNIIADLEKKYNIDYENLTACYYRAGACKVVETNLIPFDQYMEKVREVKKEHPETRFLFTTDELEYIDIFTKEFPNTVIINELIPPDDDLIFGNPDWWQIQNPDQSLNPAWAFQHGLLMLANVIIMSKAKHIICTSGNVSMWVMLYRGHAKNTHQYLSHKEELYGHKNDNYDPNQTEFWLPQCLREDI